MPSRELPPADPEALPNSVVLAGPPGEGSGRGEVGRRPSRLPGDPICPRSTATGCAFAADGRRAVLALMKRLTPAALTWTIELAATGPEDRSAWAYARGTPAARVRRVEVVRWTACVTTTAVPERATIGPPDWSWVTVARPAGSAGRRLVESTIVGVWRSEPPTWLAPDGLATGVGVVGSADEFRVIALEPDSDAARLVVLGPLVPDVVSIVMPLALAITASPDAGGAAVLAAAAETADPDARRPTTAASRTEARRLRDPLLRSLEEVIVRSLGAGECVLGREDAQTDDR
jgi:hypothetical protein